MNTLYKLIYVLTAGFILTGLLALAPVTAKAATCTEWHVVQKGESLETIAREYEMSVQELINMNHLRNPRHVEPGTILCVETGFGHSDSYPPPSKAYSYSYYSDKDAYSHGYYHAEGDCSPPYDYDDHDCYYSTGCDYGDQSCYYSKDCDYGDHDCYYPDDCDFHDYDCSYPEACKHDEGYYPHNYADGNCYYHSYSDDAIRDWNFSVVRVRKDRDVTIQANSFPHYSTFQVEMRYDGGPWVYSDQLTGGGSYKATVPIPHQLRGYSPLIVRVTKYPDAVNDQETFVNRTYYESSYGGKVFASYGYKYEYDDGYEGIPTIWIEKVVQDKSVTIRTYNFPPYLKFNVYMGKMGTKGKGGYYAGDFYSGPGGTFYVTVAIPPQLKGEAKIAIRTESTEKGYYSYSWFNNKTAY